MLPKVNGVSLMEVLVTTLVLGIGLLGVAALQITSLNSNQEGYFRSQATEIAESLASKMRTARMSIYDGTTSLNDVISSYTGSPYDCSNPSSCISGSCNESELIAFDRYQVCNSAASELPEGEVYVQNVSGIRSRIAVAWTPVSAREDIGQKQIINSECVNVGIPDTKDCVILEVIP